MRCAKVWVSCDSSALVGAFTRRKRSEPSQRSTCIPSSNNPACGNGRIALDDGAEQTVIAILGVGILDADSQGVGCDIGENHFIQCLVPFHERHLHRRTQCHHLIWIHMHEWEPAQHLRRKRSHQWHTRSPADEDDGIQVGGGKRCIA